MPITETLGREWLRCEAPRAGFLRTSFELVKQAPEMIDVMVHAKVLFDEIGHNRTGPPIVVVARPPLSSSTSSLMGCLAPSLGALPGFAQDANSRLRAPHMATIHSETLNGLQSFVEQCQHAQVMPEFFCSSSWPHGVLLDHTIDIIHAGINSCPV